MKMTKFRWCSLVIGAILLEIASGGFSTAPSTPSTPSTQEVPLEFPKSNQNYTFVDNSTIRQSLVNHSAVDTELDDLLGLDVTKETPKLPPPAIKPPESRGEETLKSETEWIENGDDTEDNRFLGEETSEKGLFSGTVAAILVGTFLVGCIIGYVGLILWRRYLEMKYGSREMLVTEDFGDPDDLKHFSI